MNKKIKYLTIGCLIIMILGFVGIDNIAPYAITQPPKINGSITPEKLGLKSEALNLKTKDNVELSGYWIKSELDAPKGVIILLHGIGGCKEHFLGLANELSKKGIESIIFDGRAHGKSGGEFCTYGFKEKKDIAQIVDKIKKQQPTLPIGIWGNSLGGAIAIQALEFDERIKFGIIESTFTDLHQIVFDYKKRILKGIGIKHLSDFALERAGEIADFEPQKIKPIESVKNIEQSIFIAHGDSDKNISFKYGQQLFDNLKTKDKQFVLIKGGGHFDLFEKGGSEYKSKMMDFIQRNLMLPPKDSIEEKSKQISLNPSQEDKLGELKEELVEIELQYYSMMCPCPQWATKENIQLYEELLGTENEIPMDSLFMLIEPENEKLPNPFDLNYSENMTFNFTGKFYTAKRKWKTEDGNEFNCKVFQFQQIEISK